jgi:hypothetical protein
MVISRAPRAAEESVAAQGTGRVRSGCFAENNGLPNPAVAADSVGGVNETLPQVALIATGGTLELLVTDRLDLAWYFETSYASLREDVVKVILKNLGVPTDPSAVPRTLGALRERLDVMGNRYPVLIDEAEVMQVCRRAVA